MLPLVSVAASLNLMERGVSKVNNIVAFFCISATNQRNHLDLQRCVILHVRMKDSVSVQTSVPVQRSGRDTFVMSVSNIGINVYLLFVYSIITVYCTCVCTPVWCTSPLSCAAICNVPCQNGGTCSAPGNCSCTAHWEGDNCEFREYIQNKYD